MPTSVEEDWHPARLLPTVGLRGEEEKEQRATSSLLAVMYAVPEFARGLLADLGAPRGRVSTFAEVQVKDAAGKLHIPDGAIIVKRGQTHWRCLVEVKTGAAELSAEQISRYLDWAKDNSFDAVLTISNQITGSANDSPVAVDGRKLRRVGLFHLSWWRVLTEAIVHHRHKGVSDREQAWLLGELVAYLDHERSGAGGFQGMGDQWVSVRTAAGNETLRAGDPQVRQIAERWEQFVDYLSLGLSQDLGVGVTALRPRRTTQEARLDAAVKRLADTGKLEGALKVPDAVGNITVEADLRTKRVTTSVEVAAPRSGGAKRRINWLLRQLKDAPGELRIDVRFVNAHETGSALLSEAHDAPERLLSTVDLKREPRSFQLALTQKMGSKRGKEEGSFARETRAQAISFYREIVQELTAWRSPAPRLPVGAAAAPEAASPEPPRFSDDDERDPGEGTDPSPN